MVNLLRLDLMSVGRDTQGENGLKAICEINTTPRLRALPRFCATTCGHTLPKRLLIRIQAFSLLSPRKRHTAIPQAPSSQYILAEHRSLTRRMQRIGREVLRGSSFSYAGYSIYLDGCLLTRSLLSDRSFRIYRGYFHFHKLSESTARPQCYHPIPPYTNIPTASWILQCYYE